MAKRRDLQPRRTDRYLSAMQLTPWLDNRWIRRLGFAAHYVAVASLLFAIEIALFGGVRIEIAMRFLSATHLLNPLIFGVLGVLLGRLLRPDIPWRLVP